MSRYARVLEKLNASVAKLSNGETGQQPEGAVLQPASTLLPRSGDRRQELERLRGAVVLANQLHGIQVILVCGSREDDGATLVSVELALTLAEMDRTTVTLADVTQSPPGVESFLKGVLPGRHLNEVIPPGSKLVVQQTRVQNLYLVARPPDGLPLMALVQPLDLLRRLRERFKYVIINAPPVVAHPDTALLATKADGVILVAHADKSRLEELEAAKTEFVRVNANILGVVLSQRKEHLPKLLAAHM
jgi:Mrp family chromosome partitioning ATPase